MRHDNYQQVTWRQSLRLNITVIDEPNGNLKPGILLFWICINRLDAYRIRCLYAWEQNSKLRPDASLHKGFTKDRAAEWPAPFVAGD